MNATMSLEMSKHQPVMLDQVLSIISPQHGGTFIDCTFGGGGYSRAILNYPNTKVLAIDRDQNTKIYADKLLKEFPKRFDFINNKFSKLGEVINSNINPKAIIFDLGISSIQLSDNKRGFSFKSKNILNMEMGINKYTAYDVVNSLDKKILTKIIKILGDEKDASKIANKIVNYRKKKVIKTSEELSSIISEAKINNKNYKKNPATKTFQAIRIFVNQELTELILGLIEATKILKKDGVLIVVSFHSLEDKIVKNFFSLYSNIKQNPSRYFPIGDNNSSLYKIFSKKPLTPTNEEIINNIRSRSAKMRYGIRNKKLFLNFKEFEKKFINFSNLEQMSLSWTQTNG